MPRRAWIIFTAATLLTERWTSKVAILRNRKKRQTTVRHKVGTVSFTSGKCEEKFKRSIPVSKAV